MFIYICIYIYIYIYREREREREPSKLQCILFHSRCNLNGSGEFSKYFHVIYPNELQVTCEHHGLWLLS